MKLKQFIFDYLRKRMPERNPRFPHLDQPLKVMIVYESDLLERNDAIKSIRQDLLRRQMDVTMWGYVEKKVINTLILPQSRILGVGDYNFFGKRTTIRWHAPDCAAHNKPTNGKKRPHAMS